MCNMASFHGVHRKALVVLNLNYSLAQVIELEALTAEFFATLSTKTITERELVMWMTEGRYALSYL